MPPTTTPPVPIRVGIIGFSPSPTITRALANHLRYFLSPHGLQKLQKFPIVAVCCSSVAVATKAVEYFSLPAPILNGILTELRAYDSPAELAADENVDMVFCYTHTDWKVHPIRPAIEAGKMCYVEWPLGRNEEEARELTDLAKSKGIRTVVGLEDRFNPVVRTVGELLQKRKIGKVVACGLEVMGYMDLDRKTQKKACTHTVLSALSFPLAHTLSALFSVLGPLDLGTLSSALSSTKSTAMDISMDTDGPREVPRTIYNNLSMQARLAEHGPAVLSVRYRAQKPPKREASVQWRIEGEEAELMVKTHVIFAVENPVSKISLHRFESGEVEDVPLSGLDDVGPVPEKGRNMVRLFRAFERAEEGFVDWEVAAAIHEALAAIYEMNVIRQGHQPKDGDE